MAAVPWKVSLHGGHSGQFCEHADDTLRSILEQAVASGMAAYGVSEHAPRSDPRFLYPSEKKKGYTIERLASDFDRYARESRILQAEFEGRLAVLRGFETEVVPSGSYQELAKSIRSLHGFDYVVGSVHHVEEIPIDESPMNFSAAVAACGGLEELFVRYYQLVQEMIQRIRPDVVGHLDLPKLHAPPGSDLATERIRRVAEETIEVASSAKCILDLNTAAWRKGLSEPYPAPWLVRLAAKAGIPFCFGDDSHRCSEVGYGLDRGKQYLLSNGVETVTVLERRDGTTARRRVPLQPAA